MFARYLSTIFALLLLGNGLLVQGGQAGQPARGRPNIVFIMSDDHACSAIGAYGSWLGKHVETPNIDRLAKQGMRFTNYVVTNSICTPSRAAILTGKYSHKNGVYTLADPLDPHTNHFVRMLQAAGYQTAIVGKWHLHTDPVGFDYWNILPGQGRYIDPVLLEKGVKKKVLHKGYSEDVITDLSLEWLKKRDKNRPFILCCHFKAPHRPWDPPPRYAQHYKKVTFPEPETLHDEFANRTKSAAMPRMRLGQDFRPVDTGGQLAPEGLDDRGLRKWGYQIYLQRYLACVKAVDDNVGRLLAFLEREGLSENTIVIYTSDQGFFLGEHGWYDKRIMYEPCIVTPLIVRYPQRVAPNTVNHDMVLNVDHAPTWLEYAGLQAPKDMQGRSFKTLLEGKTPGDWRQSMYYRYWMHLADHHVPAHYGVRTNQYTLIHYYGKPLDMKGAKKEPTEPEWELFDRKNDPLQVRNVYNDPAYAPVVRELKAELQRLREQLEDTR